MALVDEPPLQLAGHDVGPGLAELTPPSVALAERPAVDLRKEGPLREHQVAVEPLERVAAQEQLDGGAEDLAQLQIDTPNSAMEIHLVIEVEPRAQEHVEGFCGVRVERQAPLRDKGIVEDALDVHRPGGHTTYIGIARDVVHVVRRVGADQGGLQGGEPGRWDKTVELAAGNEVGDPARIDPLAVLEVGAWGGGQPADQVAQRSGDQGAPDDLVVDAPGVQVVLVEEMTERAVTDVVQP